MGATLELDWEAIRTLAVSIGIKPAAEHLGIMNHLDALYQRSKREGWLEGIPRNQALPATVSRPVSCVSSPSQAMASNMRNDAIRGRAAALRVSRRALERVDRCDDDELITSEVADVAHKWVKSAATAGGYGASDTVARVDLRVTGAHEVSAEQPVVQEADWTDAEMTGSESVTEI